MSACPHVLDMTVQLDQCKPGRYRRAWTTAGVQEVGRDDISIPHREVDLFEQVALLPRSTQLAASADSVKELIRKLELSYSPEEVLRGGGEVIGDLAKALGTRLFDSVFTGELRTRYSEVYQTAQKNHGRLRLRLQLDERLQNVPFELLYDVDHGLFLAANTFTILVRGTIGTASNLPPPDYPLRLLVVVAEPGGVAKLNAKLELEELRKSLTDLCDLGAWEVETLQGVDTLGQLQTRTDKQRFHALHFIGHGAIDVERGRSELVLVGADGGKRLVGAETLRGVLAGYTRLRLLVLNACYGGRQVGMEPFSSLAHQLLQLKYSAMVVMQRQVADQSAVDFTSHLYRAIVNSQPIDEAVTAARAKLKEDHRLHSVFDWFNPQVFLHGKDGQLFAPQDGSLPWERKASEALQQDELDRVLTIYQAAGLWDGGRDGSSSGRVMKYLNALADKATDSERWDILGQLVDRSEIHKSRLPERETWRRVARLRRKWETHLESLKRRFHKGDLISISQAYYECRRLVDLLVNKRKKAKFYKNDARLYKRFSERDLNDLVKLQKKYDKKARLPFGAVRIIELLDKLLSSRGLPVAPPADFCVAPDEGLTAKGITPAQSHAKIRTRTSNVVRVATADENHGRMINFFVHPLQAPANVAEAREAILKEGSLRQRQSSTDWMRKLRPILGRDFPLLLRGLNQLPQAIATWEAEALNASDPVQALAAHHHLALSSFPLTNGKNPRPKRAWTTQMLNSWAVLFASDPNSPNGYWYEWCRRWERDRGETLADGQSLTLMTLLREWLQTELSTPHTPRTSGDPRTLQPAVRDLELHSIEDTPITPLANPGRPSELAKWFEEEIDAARLLSHVRIAERWPALVGGPHNVRHSGLEHQLADMHTELADRSFLPSTTATSPDHLFELRSRFSSLTEVWTAIQRHRDPAKGLELLSGLACLACKKTDTSSSFKADIELPIQVRPRVCRTACATFERMNLLYVALSGGYACFIEDVRRLTRTALLELACQAFPTKLEEMERFAEVMNWLQSVPEEWPDTARSLQDLQQTAIDHLNAAEQSREPDAVARALDILKCLVGLKRTPYLTEALTRGFLLLAKESDELDCVRTYAAEALSWSPESVKARILLASKLLARANSLTQVGLRDAAEPYLSEFRKVCEEAPRKTTKWRNWQRRQSALQKNQTRCCRRRWSRRRVGENVIFPPNIFWIKETGKVPATT